MSQLSGADPSRFQESGHTNVRAYKTWLKYCAGHARIPRALPWLACLALPFWWSPVSGRTSSLLSRQQPLSWPVWHNLLWSCVCFCQRAPSPRPMASSSLASGQGRGTEPRVFSAPCAPRSSRLAVRFCLLDVLQDDHGSWGFHQLAWRNFGPVSGSCSRGAQAPSLLFRASWMLLWFTRPQPFKTFIPSSACSWPLLGRSTKNGKPLTPANAGPSCLSLGLVRLGGCDHHRVSLYARSGRDGMMALTRQDLVLPETAMSSDPVAYVHIHSPRTQRFPRRQHSRLDDPTALRLLTSLYPHLPLGKHFFRGSPHTYRRQWKLWWAGSGSCWQGGHPKSPQEQRRYFQTEDLWHGAGWSKTRTVEFHLQEVAAQPLF